MADTSETRALRFPPFHVPAGVEILYREQTVVSLEPRAVRVLRYLVEHRDRIVTKEELLDTIWADIFTTDAVLKTAVAKIRRALGQTEDGPQWVETHHKRGYRFVGAVETAPEPAAEAPAHAATNLPQPVTRFVGREREVEMVRETIATARLVTLTGPGGIGKTRLALEAASGLVETSPDGVWLVELAGVADPALVPGAVAAALGVREEADMLGSLRAWVGGKRLVVVLDNCEHLVEECARLAAELLRAGRGLRILATSREALAIAGEAVRPVPPLAEEDAVSLFVDRALLRNPEFELSPVNAPFVADVCRGLDGIPLALELAAARARVLTAEQIAARLEDRFRLLAPADRSAPVRHRTLRAAVDWSHELLSDEERVLLRRLSVFAGGFTLESAECSVLSAESSEHSSTQHSALGTQHLLERLVDKSLISWDGARYGMLETIRRYAAEKLGEAGEERRARAAHVGWFAVVAEGLYANAYGNVDESRLGATLADYDNLRAAMRWGFGPDGDAESAARIAVALGLFWQVRGHWTEGRRWLEMALAAHPEVSPPVRAGALFWSGVLAQEQGELEPARERLERSLALRREEGDDAQVAKVLHTLGTVTERMGRLDESEAYRKEFLSITTGERFAGARAQAANSLGLSALARGDYERAAALFGDALALFEGSRDSVNASVALHNLGDLALRRGDPAAAADLLRRSVAAARDGDARRVVAYSTHLLGYASIELGEGDEALILLGEALELHMSHGDREGVAFVLEGLTRASAPADGVLAFRLAGAADALRETLQAPLPSAEREVLGRILAPAREAIGPQAADEALRTGRSTSFERAVDLARETVHRAA